MFHSIYITTSSGSCIFEEHFLRRDTVDGQLLSGFINALGAFATEALGSEMQSLQLQTGEQMFIYPHKESSLIGIAIVDSKDNPKLIRKLLRQIMTDFTTIFHRQLEPQTPTDITPFKEFRFTIETILRGKISSRTNLKMFAGIIIGIFLMAGILLALVPLIYSISSGDISQYGFTPIDFSDGLNNVELQTLQTVVLVVVVALMGFYCLEFLIPSVIAAYIAGNRKRGIWTALLICIAIGLMTLIRPISTPAGEFNAFLWYAAFSPLFISLAILCGMYGGRLKEQRKLYPLPESMEGGLGW